MKIRKHMRRGSYNLFSNYNHYLPGMSGMMLLFVLFLAGALLGNSVIGVLGIFCPPQVVSAYSTLVSYPIMFIPPMLYASAQSRRRESVNEGVPVDRNDFGKFSGLQVGLVVSFATIAAAFVVEPMNLLLPPMPEWLESVMNQLLLNCPFWVTLISVSVFAPVFEEWLCRGIVLRGLLTKMSPFAAICISAAFFAVLHMNPWQAIPAFVLGLLFGYVYYKTGSLKLTMLMHCVNNTFSAVLSRFPSLAEAETFMDVMSGWAYGCVYAACLLIAASALVILKGSGTES